LEKLQLYFHRVRKLLDITFFRVVFFIVLGMVLYAVMFSNVRPEKLNLSLFTVANKTIRSPITVEDKQSTEQKRKEAVDQVKDVYVKKNEYTQNRVDLISSIFDSALDVIDGTNSDGSSNPQLQKASTSDKVNQLKAKLTDRVVKDLSDQDLTALVQANHDDLSNAKDLTVTAINNIMSEKISAADIQNAKNKIEDELNYSGLSGNLKKAAIDLGRYAVVQNEFYDPNATKELQKQAAESVEPVKILQGQIIVQEGELITSDIYRQLKLVGLLNSTNSFNPFYGLALLIAIFLVGIYHYFYQLKTTDEKKHTNMLIFGMIFSISVLIMKMTSLMQTFNFSGISYLFPAALAGMLIKILIDENLAILTTAIMAVCGSVVFNEGISATFNFSAGIYILLSSLAGILYLNNQNRRSKILQAGMFSAVVNVVTIMAILLLSNGQYMGLEYVYYVVTAVISGIASAVLTIGLLPFFEVSFGILSTMKLIELSNPNHPLLRKILTEAPGTYHHSLMVANLAESACEAIGANGLIARVGCYYHDIGKTRRPNFFIENQLNHDNPHDRLPPEKSAEIIVAHVTDGVNILKRYRIPKEIIDIAEQHHGTTILKYFYHRAMQEGLKITENDFRYPGPKAQTKESAVVGIADSVEAAVRSLKQPTPEQIENLVKKIIDDRLSDGQLSECELTLREVDIIFQTLCESVKGIFHSRIEYPNMTNQKVKQA
jgi:putative nucleotidyltransferase with HDIG domain